MFYCPKSPLNNYTKALFNINASYRGILFQELLKKYLISCKSELYHTKLAVAA